MPTLISDKIVTARKTHLCCTCDALAADVGQKYRRTTYAYDGVVYNWVQCQACKDLAPAIYDWSSAYADEGITRDDYNEWAYDHKDADNANGEAARDYLLRIR